MTEAFTGLCIMTLIFAFGTIVILMRALREAERCIKRQDQAFRELWCKYADATNPPRTVLHSCRKYELLATLYERFATLNEEQLEAHLAALEMREES